MNNKTEASLEKLWSAADRIAAALENLVDLKLKEMGLKEEPYVIDGDNDGLSWA